MDEFEEDYQVETPTYVTIIGRLRTPLVFFYFFKQRARTLNNREAPQDAGDIKPDSWIGPLEFALVGAILLAAIVAGMLLLLTHATSYLGYGRARHISEMQAQLQAINTQIVNLEEKRDRIVNSAPAASPPVADSNDSAAQSLSFLPNSQPANPGNSSNVQAQNNSLDSLSEELFALESERTSLEKPIRELRWASWFYFVWQIAALPVTMILTAYACRNLIGRRTNIDGLVVSSRYLLLSTSFAFVPAIVSAFLMSLFGAGIDDTNHELMRIVYSVSTISVLWYFGSLYSASRRLSTFLGMSLGSERIWISFITVSANIVLFVSWEGVYFLLAGVFNAAVRKLA